MFTGLHYATKLNLWPPMLLIPMGLATTTCCALPAELHDAHAHIRSEALGVVRQMGIHCHALHL